MFKKRNPRNPISLTGLIELEFSKEQIEATKQKIEAEIAAYKEKYGEEGELRYYRDMCKPNDYDSMIKRVNRSIYEGSYGGYCGSPDALRYYYENEDRRTRELFGDRYDELIFHKPNDPVINEILIADAIKTGKWKELPDELQEEYHKRMATL